LAVALRLVNVRDPLSRLPVPVEESIEYTSPNQLTAMTSSAAIVEPARRPIAARETIILIAFMLLLSF
jgi:hypothetical protein